MPDIAPPPAQPIEGQATKDLRYCLARIAAENDKLHAVSRLFTDEAMAQAMAIDAKKAAGETPGKLHGLPIVVKELIDIQGQPTEFGSLAYATTGAVRNAPVIDRLLEAGAVIVGTTHMVEFAIGSWGTNHAKGTPWNPADRAVHRTPGGSSSGSAVAVAADLVPAAIGSDTGGSVRIPASLCGVVGFKPTYDLIPTEGVAPLGPTFDTLGPITRTVADARRLTEVMSGRNLDHPAVGLDGLRVAVINPDALAPISTQVAQSFASAMTMFADHGTQIVEIDLPLSFVELQRLNGDIVAYEAYRHLSAIVEDLGTPLDPHVRARVLAGRHISADQYNDRLAELTEVRDAFRATFADHDLLALPGTPLCAVPVSEVNENEIPLSRYTRAANCLDLCAISLPLTRASGALPVGLQLCAPAHSDAFLLAAAETVAGLTN